MNNSLEWQKGLPKFEGLYLVAVRYPNGLGEIDLYNWRGEWTSLYHEERIPNNYQVVGYVSMQGMVKKFRGDWPEWDGDE
ncbi:hypothetical protein [Microbulbifer sp. VAAF005]|uniref:hypothetical protein n=1 Tax=Microbulbifer sp. VAAF005 TaxID=3034230 RepID=UPI0024AD3569|nr:hypothetical protein [Microbulbifer sp. VAAF005]WHI45969.1 hypothetical protein P0078_19955 [Microbulbifer sp. VAAF005]